MLSKRWSKAHKAEAKFWETRTQPHKVTERERREALARIYKFTLLSSEERLEQMRILEIGGTFIMRAFCNVGSSPKIVLDPLIPNFTRFTDWQDKPCSCHRVQGVGEYLPLANRSIDLCWCTNAIDHTSSPIAVLREIKRVLDDGQMLMISCDIFPTWTRLFFPLFNIMDKPHPHHFTLGSFEKLLKQEFQLQGRIEVDPLRWKLAAEKTLKVRIAGIIGVRHFHFRCIPKSPSRGAELSQTN